MGNKIISPDRGDWSAKIIRTWRQSVESIIETGRLIREAKAALAHGEFERMIADELPFNAPAARKLMAIAGDERIVNRSQGNELPPNWTTLYQLTTLSDDQFDAKLAAGAINPDMKRRDVAPEPGPDDAIDMRSETTGRPLGESDQRQARGFDIGDGRRRIVITLGDDTFEQIATRVRASQERGTRISFNEEVNTLLEWALEAYDRWEAEAGAA